nr:metallo-beta-lactamase domain protein [Trichoderma calamagrostidis]
MGEGGYRQINKSLIACAFDEYLTAQQSRLPNLLDVEQLSPRVIRVLGQNAGKFTLQGTNTYIVGTGKHRLIIDTAQGYRAWAGLIEITLEEHSIGLSHVFLTHWHDDHTKGVPDLIRMHPHLADAIYKNSPEAIQNPIDDGQVFKVEGATVRAVHTPGHSHDHICFILEEENAMFTGDNVLGHGTSVVEHLGLFMDSLRKMQSHECAVGYPAHGAVIPNLPAKIASELARKTRREKQCLVALDQIHREKGKLGRLGSVSISELIQAIHGEQLDEQVRKMVIGPFMDEVLRKLAEDGKVGFCVQRGVKKWFALSTLTVSA